MTAVAAQLPASEQDDGSDPATAHAPATPTIDDLATIKKRLLEPLLQAPQTDAARDLLRRLRPDGSWPDVDYDNARRSSWSTTRHLSHVSILARAYRSPQSDLHRDADLRQAVLSSLDFWLDRDFQNSNWWWNQIGVPRSVASILLLLEDELSDAQRTQGLEILKRAKIGMTGQNLVWVTEITALRGILEKNPDLVATAYRRIAEEIRVAMGEGIQPDFSFHQHGPCLYSHGYGAAFAVDCPRIATQVAGTGLAFPPEKIEILTRLILDGSQWMTRGPVTDFGAEGREITRMGQNALYLATAAESMLALSTGREQEFRALADRVAGRPAPPLEGNRHFWRSDVMVHHRPGYYTSARMFSRRLANTDGPANSEGLKSHHISDGCNPILRTGREYHEIFPVWDWRKIPGTTVQQRPELTGSPRTRGERSFVGGVSDGTYGLAVFDLVRDGLEARKSWFFFDDEYACLGAGIRCESDHPVATTLNQCHLEGDVLVGTGAEAGPVEPGTHALDRPRWVWHDRIAYVMLEPAPLQLHNDVQRGTWNSINQRYPDEEIARNVFSLWIDHGTRPESARYAYVVVPNVDPAAAAAHASRPGVKVLHNEPSVQAVWHEGLKIAGLAFYEAGQVEIRKDLAVAVDTPCLILLRELSGQGESSHGDGLFQGATGGLSARAGQPLASLAGKQPVAPNRATLAQRRLADRLTISVSNPENEKATVRLQISGKLRGDGVRVSDDEARSSVLFELPDGMDAGKTVTRTLLR